MPNTIGSLTEAETNELKHSIVTIAVAKLNSSVDKDDLFEIKDGILSFHLGFSVSAEDVKDVNNRARTIMAREINSTL